MRAAFYRRKGPASEVLEIGPLDQPAPGPGEVRVEVRASGVNPSDVKNRSGFYNDPMSFPLIIPHSDGAGIIDAVGAGIERGRVGERVWLWNAQFQRPFGTAAEYVALPAAQAVPLPPTTDFAAGACLGVPALTAYRAVTIDGSVAGQTILVSGGAGAVGHYAVQFAKRKGARVIATVSSAAKAEHVRAAGVDEIVNYRTEDVAARVKALTAGRGADKIIEMEFGANLPLLPQVLARHGTVYVVGSAQKIEPNIHIQQLLLHNVTLHFRSVYWLPEAVRQAAIADLNAMMSRNELIHAVGARYPLAEIARAHEAVEKAAVIGNVVVEIA